MKNSRLLKATLSALILSHSFVPLLGNAQESPSSIDGLGDLSAFTEKDSKDPDELINQAEVLMAKKQGIDARAKLQKALEISPDDYRIHLKLGQYYLAEVGQFTLAYRYIRKSEELFMKKFGNPDGSVDPINLRDQVFILYLKSEAELNLDKYQDSLNTLDKLAQVFPPAGLGWYNATRAWVLMKLKRTDEALQTAQQGLIVDEDSKRIYNILGILLSVRGERELSLKAFSKAITTELAYGSMGQAATPLNNIGEVYRELFRDNLAEASWIKALQMKDGCDHVLPSLNMSFLYIDQGRFLQADRVLRDFEACYAAYSSREDTEHRALLALSKGRIALHEGDFDSALTLLKDAEEREQWFGKIGTDENDVRLASGIAMANALTTEVNMLHDITRDKWSDYLQDLALIPQLKIRSWWLQRQARRLAVEKMDDFEDLSIRNSDTMIEYPTLGSTLAGFPTTSLRRRLNRIMETDKREGAKQQYEIYLAQNLLAHGSTAEALEMLNRLKTTLRPIDRLAKAQVLTLLLQGWEQKKSWWRSQTVDERTQIFLTQQELYELLPSQIRAAGLALPVVSNQYTTDGSKSRELERVRKLLQVRLPEVEADLQPLARYSLRLQQSVGSQEGTQITMELLDKVTGNILSTETGTIAKNGEGTEALLNKFLTSTFHHRRDPNGEPIQQLEFLEELTNNG